MTIARSKSRSIPDQRIPSFAGLMRNAAWADTVPSGMGTDEPLSEPFSEVLEGLAVREVRAPGWFRRFFGQKAA